MKKKTVLVKGVLVSILIAIFCSMMIVTLIVIEFQKKDMDLIGLWENAMLGVLCSVVASIIFTIIARIYSRNDSDAMDIRLEKIETQLARQSELYDSGIKSIRPKSHFDEEDDYWNGIINGCINRLDLVGHSLSNSFGKRYRDAFIKKVIQIVNSGGSVNVVLSTPTPENIETMLSNVLDSYQNNKVINNKVEKTLLGFYRIINDSIAVENRHNLKIYVIDVERVTYFYIRTDVQCIISPYTSSSGMRENIFLLELCPNTSHVKILEDDFDEIINNIYPVDFQSKESESMKVTLWLDKQYSTENNYKSREWNHEITHKYIFRDNYRIYEAGFFKHYNNNIFVKEVIELPVGFGCPSQCSYCASACIKGFYPLDAHQMLAMFQRICLENKIDKTDHILLSMTGMGDIFFNQTNVLNFLNTLQEYKNLSLTLSSNFWTTELLNKMIAINNILPIRYIQYTYVSYKPELRKKLVKILNSLNEKDYFDEFISFIKSSDKAFFRINYIVIHEINDSSEDITQFINLVTEIKDKLIVRISQLNETGSTKKNGLRQTDYVRLGEINEQIKNSGIQSYVFYAEKNDNMNCGQLLTESI